MDGLGETITVAPHPLAPHPVTILGGTSCVPRAFNKSLSYFFLSATLGRGVGRGPVGAVRDAPLLSKEETPGESSHI